MDETSLGEHLSEEMDGIAASNSFEHECERESPDNVTLSQLDRNVFPISEETEEHVSEEHNSDDMFEDVPEPLTVTPGPLHATPPLPSRPVIPMVSQTRPEVEDVDSDDDEEDPGSVRYMEADFDEIAKDANNTFDPSSEDMEEVEAIVDHRFVAGILELSVRYSTDELTWHPLELVKDIDPHTVAHYVIVIDLGPISNGKHCRWARVFLRSLK